MMRPGSVFELTLLACFCEKRENWRSVLCLGSVLQRISAGLDQDSSVNYSVPSSSSHVQFCITEMPIDMFILFIF